MSRGSKKLAKLQYSQAAQSEYYKHQDEQKRLHRQSPDYIEWQAAIKAYNTDVKQREECKRLGIIAKGVPLAPVPRSLSAYIKSRDYMQTYSGKAPFKRDKDYDSISGEVRPYDAPRYDYVFREIGLHHKQKREEKILDNGGRFKRIIHGGDILRKNRSEDGISRVHIRPKRELRPKGDLDIPNPPKQDKRTQSLYLYWWHGNPGDSGNIPSAPTHKTVISADYKPGKVASRGLSTEQNFSQGEVQ